MDRIEQRILDIIDQNAEKIIAFGDDIWHHAELPYEEHRTSQKFCEHLDTLGLPYEKGIAITGVKSLLKEKSEGEIILGLMGELDALPFPDHVDANPETGAAHCCGHNAQLTGVMGATIALTDPEVQAALGGNVAFMAVPSEEASANPNKKDELMASGQIKFLGGKCEFIRLGAMDDVDMVVGHHTNAYAGGEDAYGDSNSTSMGFIEKYITYRGIAQHPANANISVDAQSAATLAMHAIDLQREGINQFHKWNTHILHGYIRSGGMSSNVISDKVEMDYNIRAKTIDAMLDIGYRVDRSLKGAAIATGAGMEVRTVAGYLPINPVKDSGVINEVFDLVDPDHKHGRMMPEISGTTDYGDLSCIMPVLQFLTIGYKGTGHTLTFEVADPYEYYVVPAKCFALLAYRLLKDNAARAKQMLAENKPMMTKEEYLELMDTLSKTDTEEMVPVPKTFV